MATCPRWTRCSPTSAPQGAKGDNGVATGGDGFTPPGTNTGISNLPTVVAQTGPLPAGTYYVTATALLDVASGDIIGVCYITKASSPNSVISEGGGGTQTGAVQGVPAAETVAVSVAAGDALQEGCLVGGKVSGSYAVNAGITRS